MSVRKMRAGDVNAVSRLVVGTFMASVADTLSTEGVATFMKLSAVDAFAKRMNEDNLMYVYVECDEILGMVELKEGRHVAMLFVAPERQSCGIGRELIQEVVRQSRFSSITVKASIPSVPAYMNYGFEVVGPEAEEMGLRFIPMRLDLGSELKTHKD